MNAALSRPPESTNPHASKQAPQVNDSPSRSRLPSPLKQFSQAGGHTKPPVQSTGGGYG